MHAGQHSMLRFGSMTRFLTLQASHLPEELSFQVMQDAVQRCVCTL